MRLVSLAGKFLRSRQKRRDLSRYFHLPYVFDYPSSASIEMTNFCNLKCPVCQADRVVERPKGRMKYESYVKILDEIGPRLTYLELTGFGETFMNRDIYRMIAHTRKVNPATFIYIDTNGHFMDAGRLVASPPDELVFSVDGLDQQTYQAYRVGGNLGTVLGNIEACVAARREAGASKPRIVLKFICMSHNEHQREQVPAFARRIGADDYRLESFTSRTVEHARRFMSTVRAFQKYDDAQLRRGRLAPFMRQLDTPCDRLWQHADVYWNGDVVPCCTDYSGRHRWGNVFEEGSFWRVWNSAKAREFRKLHRRSDYRSRISICGGCYLTNFEYVDQASSELSQDGSGRFRDPPAVES